MSKEPLLNKSNTKNSLHCLRYTEGYQDLNKIEEGRCQSRNNKEPLFAYDEALKEVLKPAWQKTLAASSTRLKPFEIAIMTVLAVAAVISGLLFWEDSEPAAKRHFGNVGNSVAAVFPVMVACFGGAAANILFNFECYLTLKENIKRKRSKAEMQLTTSGGEAIKWILAFFIGIFAVLPFLLMSSIKNGWNIASAILNIGPNMDGAKNLTDPILNPLFQWVQSIQCRNPVHAYFSDHDPNDLYEKEALKQRTLRKVKYLIVDQFNRIADDASGVYHYEKDNSLEAVKAPLTAEVSYTVSVTNDAFKTKVEAMLQKFFGEHYKDEHYEKGFEYFFNALLTYDPPQNKSMQRSCANYTGKYLFRFCFAFLVISGLSANVGFAGVTYSKLRELTSSHMSESASKFMAWAGAFFHTVPGIGFTIKGLSGLWEFGNKFVNGQQTIPKAQARAAYRILGVFFGVMALFSGFSADQANYSTYQLFIRFGGVMAATLFGIIGNIGTAVPFNLPQLLELLERMILFFLMIRKTPQNDLLKREKQEKTKMLIEFIEQVNRLANVVKKMPEDTLDVLLNHGHFKSDFLQFVTTAQNEGKISVEELRSLGDEYAKRWPKQALTDDEQFEDDRYSYLPTMVT